MNPFSPLYQRCNSGTAEQKHKGLGDFPIIIDVEPVGLCNYRCLMCPTGLQALGRPQGFMEQRVWRSIVNECEPHGTALRCIGWGEPLLHPDIVGMVAYASQKGLLVHLNTNASKLTPELAEHLVDAGLASIKFSFQGVDRASYAEMRRVDFFDGMLQAIRWVREARGFNRLPFIAASTSVTDEPEDKVETFRQTMSELVDHLSIGQTTFDFFDHRALRLKPAQREVLDRVTSIAWEKRHPDPCPEVWDKLSIHWDGSGHVCCNDYSGKTNLGKVPDVSLMEMWSHPTMTGYRERLSRKEYGGPLCSVCYDYASLTKGEAA